MDRRLLQLAGEGLKRPNAPSRLPERLLVVDVEQQRLSLIQDAEVTGQWLVSTASAGIGSVAGSNRTPAGWHTVDRRIGDGGSIGTVFVGRVPAGEIWDGGFDERDLILTRIITLNGLEEGVNRGGGQDSLGRHIYIHGTNHEDLLGRPASHGCIRMANREVIAVHDQLAEGDPVLIASPGS